MPKTLISKQQFATLAGVSGAAITAALRGDLAGALVVDRIDQNHETALAYLRDQGVDPEEKWPPEEMDPDPATTEVRDIGQYMHLTLSELIERFGTERSFRDWLEALNKLESLREKRLNIEERQRTLIRRELVRSHVFGAIDAGFRRLLTDTPRTIVAMIYAKAKADVPLEEAERTVREVMQKQLSPIKSTAARVLRNG